MSSGKASVKCLMCPKHFHVKDLLQHVHEHINYNPQKCNNCDFACISRSDLLQHTFDNDHRGGPNHDAYSEWLIGEISDSFLIAAKEGIRMLVEKKKKERKNFPAPSLPPLPLKCLLCPKRFVVTDILQHIHLHISYKPQKCNDCDFASIQRSDLDQHLFEYEHTGGTNIDPYQQWLVDTLNEDTQFAAQHGMYELMKRCISPDDQHHLLATPALLDRCRTLPAQLLVAKRRHDDAAAASGEKKRSIFCSSSQSSSSEEETEDDFFVEGDATDGSAPSTPRPSPSKPLRSFATPVAGEKTERTLALEDTVETASGTPSIRHSATVATVHARSTVPLASSTSPPPPTKKIKEKELEEEAPIDNTAPAAPPSTVSVVIEGPTDDEESRPQPFDEVEPAVRRAGSEAASVSSSALLAAVPFPMPHRQVSLGSICRSPKKEPEEEEPINEEKEQADAAQPPETDAEHIKKEIKKGSQGSHEFEGFTPPRFLPQQDDQKPAVDGDAEDDNDVGMEGGEGGAEDGEDGVGDDERTTRKRSATTPPPVPIKKGRKSRKGGKKATAASSGEKARKGVCTLCSREYSSTSGAYKTHARTHFPHLLPYSCVSCRERGATKDSVMQHHKHYSCKQQGEAQPEKKIAVDRVQVALLECKVKECFPDLHIEPTPSREAEFRCDLCPSSTCPVNVDHLCYHIVSEHADLEAIKMNDEEYISAIRRLFPGAHCVHKIKRYFTVTK